MIDYLPQHPDWVVIEAIEGRSEQGVLKPFLCVGEDGKRYFVKGRGAGRASLISEFVAGSLGHRLGLPIPRFTVVYLPEILIRESALEGVRELGSGLCFGSERLPFVQEIGWSHLPQISADLKRDVLLFDWWIHNQDRTFGQGDGNPNLLWDTAKNQMAVIDHNLAFDPTFDAQAFWSNHIFREHRRDFSRDFRNASTIRLESALSHLEAIFQAIPEEWQYEDQFQTVKSDFDFTGADAILRRFRNNEFWTTVGP